MVIRISSDISKPAHPMNSFSSRKMLIRPCSSLRRSSGSKATSATLVSSNWIHSGGNGFMKSLFRRARCNRSQINHARKAAKIDPKNIRMDNFKDYYSCSITNGPKAWVKLSVLPVTVFSLPETSVPSVSSNVAITLNKPDDILLLHLFEKQ